MLISESKSVILMNINPGLIYFHIAELKYHIKNIGIALLKKK